MPRFLLFAFHSGGNRKLLKIRSCLPHAAVSLRAPPEFSKPSFCLLLISVNLPQSGTFVTICPVFNKSPDILRRIAEKQADLMRKIFLFAKPSDQRRKAAITVFAAVSLFFQQALRRLICQVALQAGRANEKQKHPFFPKAQKKKAESFCSVLLIKAADFQKQFSPVIARAGKHASCLDGSKRRRALLYDDILRHFDSFPSSRRFMKRFPQQ